MNYDIMFQGKLQNRQKVAEKILSANSGQDDVEF